MSRGDFRRGKRFPVKDVVNRYRFVVPVPGGPSVLLHRFRAEQALGKPLPDGAVVHHADGSLSDNAPLVICPDEFYHKLLHRRMRVKAAGGNPNTDRICSKCRAVKPSGEFHKNRAQPDGLSHYCRPCQRVASQMRGAA